MVGEDKPLVLAAGEAFKLTTVIQIPEGHYLYSQETDVDFVSLEGLLITDIRYPKSTKYADPYLGKEVDIFRDDVIIEINGRVPEGLALGEHILTARVHFRGCSPTICYRADEAQVSFQVDVTPTASKTKPPSIDVVPPLSRDESLQASERVGLHRLLEVQDLGQLLAHGLGLTLVIVFIAGVLTSLTPCIWPVIPVVLLYVGVHPHKRLWENFLLAASLVAGLILVYAVLGLVAVSFGKNLGFLFQQRWFLAAVVLFFLAMSLSMFGVFDLRLPRHLQHRLHQLGGEGYWGAFLAGMGTGLMASPCAGPVLAAILGHVALQRNYPLGFALLVIYGMGMGLFIIILGAGYGELAGKLKSGPWMLWIRRVLGIVLLFPAAFYMGSLFRWNQVQGFGLSTSQIEWMMDEDQALAVAQKSGKAIMIEFSAEWCPPCKALEKRFFGRSDIAALASNLVPLRIDATIETPFTRTVVEKYHVVGWPTVLFLDSKGYLFTDLRVNDYNPAAIERAMKEAIRRSGHLVP